ncbi:MAG: type II toxin-antitoxin system Phd/YefM family antitoxin [Rhodoferax sp.]|nr:type II toxin-antitoxin system Phd/YefM family antitoxin [Rhodoferax sp.]
MNSWQLQEAKSRLSEVVDLALGEGPQMVTRHGRETAVVLSASDYRRLTGASSLLDVLRKAPRGEPLDVERSREGIRDIVL